MEVHDRGHRRMGVDMQTVCDMQRTLIGLCIENGNVEMVGLADGLDESLVGHLLDVLLQCLVFRGPEVALAAVGAPVGISCEQARGLHLFTKGGQLPQTLVILPGQPLSPQGSRHIHKCTEGVHPFQFGSNEAPAPLWAKNKDEWTCQFHFGQFVEVAKIRKTSGERKGFHFFLLPRIIRLRKLFDCGNYSIAETIDIGGRASEPDK